MKELKTRTSTEDDYDKVALHCDDVLEKLKTIDGHTSRNVLKKQQSFIDGVGLTPTISMLVDTKIVHVGYSNWEACLAYVEGWNVKHLVY